MAAASYDYNVFINCPFDEKPLELGIFLGAKRFGSAEQKQKTCLILDVERYRFRKFISDISGQDISAHAADTTKAIQAVRDWLSSATPSSIGIPGGILIASRYALFRKDLPAMCEKLHLKVEELTFNNYVVQGRRMVELERPGGGLMARRGA